LVTVFRMIYSIQEYEFRFLVNSKTTKKGKPVFGPDWSDPLIDIWQNYETFVLEVILALSLSSLFRFLRSFAFFALSLSSLFRFLRSSAFFALPALFLRSFLLLFFTLLFRHLHPKRRKLDSFVLPNLRLLVRLML
jgi:hypothetical protein